MVLGVTFIQEYANPVPTLSSCLYTSLLNAHSLPEYQ